MANMAIRSSRRKVSKPEIVPEVVVPAKPKIKLPSWWKGAVGVVIVLVLYWWKTENWPVVAVVNGRPVTRFELNRELFNQAGRQTLDELVVRRLVAQEMFKRRVIVSDAEVDVKLDEAKKQFGSEDQFKQVLVANGLTLDQVRDQIKFRLGLEKMIEPSTDSAKMSTDIMDLVQKLKTDGKVWTAFK